MWAQRTPRLEPRRVVHDIRIAAHLLESLPIQRALLPGRIDKDVRALIPARVELTPPAGEHHVQRVLVPPPDVLPIPLEALEHLRRQILAPPTVQIHQQDAGVEVGRVGL